MRNPVRRNKNIGKTQGGRVKGGIARQKRSRIFSQNVWRQLSEGLDNGSFVVLDENPSRDFFHPVSEADIRKTLDRMPNKLTKNLRAVVMPRLSVRDRRRGVEARRRYSCIILNPFPKSLRYYWGENPPKKRAVQHYEPWNAKWEESEVGWYQFWEIEDLKTYYLFHLLLHELGHINQPWFNSPNRREEFAEDFALQWAKKLNVLRRQPKSDDGERKRMTTRNERPEVEA